MFLAGVFIGCVIGSLLTIAAWEIQMGRVPWPARYA